MKEYQIARNNVTKAINRAKQDYYYQQITSIKKSGKLWEKLRTLLPSKKDVSKIPTKLSANDFNTYFSTIGLNITDANNILQDIKTCPYSHISQTNKILENFIFVQIPTMAIS